MANNTNNNKNNEIVVIDDSDDDINDNNNNTNSDVQEVHVLDDDSDDSDGIAIVDEVKTVDEDIVVEDIINMAQKLRTQRRRQKIQRRRVKDERIDEHNDNDLSFDQPMDSSFDSSAELRIKPSIDTPIKSSNSSPIMISNDSSIRSPNESPNRISKPLPINISYEPSTGESLLLPKQLTTTTGNSLIEPSISRPSESPNKQSIEPLIESIKTPTKLPITEQTVSPIRQSPIKPAPIRSSIKPMPIISPVESSSDDESDDLPYKCVHKTCKPRFRSDTLTELMYHNSEYLKIYVCRDANCLFRAPTAETLIKHMTKHLQELSTKNNNSNHFCHCGEISCRPRY